MVHTGGMICARAKTVYPGVAALYARKEAA